MCALRLATYNVEWFNALFDDEGAMLMDDAPSSRYKISRLQQLTALGAVFAALNADGVMIVEAPDNSGRRSTVAALQGFARYFKLRARSAVIGYTSDTEQEIAFLYDPDVLDVRHDPKGDLAPARGAPGAPRFDSQLQLDIDGDGHEDRVRFSKPPLELTVSHSGGKPFRLIGVHAKSKATHSRTAGADDSKMALENRRKQLAESLWLRLRVEQHLRAKSPLIVMGDFNDGPGQDDYEKRFGKSGVEVVMAPDAIPEMRLFDPHADFGLKFPAQPAPSTARFWIDPTKTYLNALIDFIMVSPDLAATHPAWRIWHPLTDPAITTAPALRDALLSASDHFPVTLDLAM